MFNSIRLLWGISHNVHKVEGWNIFNHLSKGDLGPFHHHYLVHSQSYITTLGEWLVHGLEAEGLAEGQ